MFLKKIPFFAAFRLDEVLTSFIEKQVHNQSNNTTSLLAHEVLLMWALHQPTGDIHEASATILLKALEVKKRCNLARSIIIL